MVYQKSTVVLRCVMLSAISRDSCWSKLDQLIRLQVNDSFINQDFDSLIEWWTLEVYAYQEAGHFQTWFIEYDGIVAGIIDIQWVNLHGSVPEELELPEIGYWLAKEFRGKGLATFAVKAMIELYGYPSYHARVHKDNMDSQGVLMRCGFSKCRYDRKRKYYLYQWNQKK